MRVSASMKLGLPGPAGGEVHRGLSRGSGDPAGEREQAPTGGRRGTGCGVGDPEQQCPAREVVRQARDYCPGAVGAVVPRWEVRQRLVFEVADDLFNDGVLAML